MDTVSRDQFFTLVPVAFDAARAARPTGPGDGETRIIGGQDKVEAYREAVERVRDAAPRLPLDAPHRQLIVAAVAGLPQDLGTPPTRATMATLHRLFRLNSANANGWEGMPMEASVAERVLSMADQLKAASTNALQALHKELWEVEVTHGGDAVRGKRNADYKSYASVLFGSAPNDVYGLLATLQSTIAQDTTPQAPQLENLIKRSLATLGDTAERWATSPSQLNRMLLHLVNSLREAHGKGPPPPKGGGGVATTCDARWIHPATGALARGPCDLPR